MTKDINAIADLIQERSIESRLTLYGAIPNDYAGMSFQEKNELLDILVRRNMAKQLINMTFPSGIEDFK